MLFSFALGVRLIYLFQIHDSLFFSVLVGDGQAYDAWAERIKLDFWGHEAFFQAPLYPYFLAALYALFGHDLLAIRVVQMLLGSAACVLLSAATSSLLSRAAGLAAGLVLALYGPALFFDGIVQKSSLDLFLTTALLYFLTRVAEPDQRRFPALAGVTLGCLALTRENALIWAPCLCAWFALRPPPGERAQAVRRRVLPLLAGLMLVLSPVALRNYAVSGQLFLTTSQFGQNFYVGNNPDADGTYQSLRFGHGAADFERRDAIELAEAASGHALSAAEVSRYWSGRAWQFIANQPGKWLGQLGKKWLLIGNAREIPDSDEPLVYADDSSILRATSALCGFGSVAPLALVGAFLALRRRILLLPLLLALSLAASTVLFFVVARYRFPLVPLLIPFAVLAATEIIDTLRERRFRELQKLALGLLVCAVVVHLEIGPEAHPRATAHYDLAVSLEALQRWEDAEKSYRSALVADPDFVEARVNFGSLLARNGQLEPAEVEERRALKLRPADALAHANLGNILFEQARLDEAVEQFEAALRIDPKLTQAREGLAATEDEMRSRRAKPAH